MISLRFTYIWPQSYNSFDAGNAVDMQSHVQRIATFDLVNSGVSTEVNQRRGQGRWFHNHCPMEGCTADWILHLENRQQNKYSSDLFLLIKTFIERHVPLFKEGRTSKILVIETLTSLIFKNLLHFRHGPLFREGGPSKTLVIESIFI